MYYPGRYDESVRAATNRIRQKEELEYRQYCQKRAADSEALRIKPVTFPLTRLPLEIQLLVLKKCLCSGKPLLNHGLKVHGTRLTVKDEPYAQADMNINIVRTCRLYRREGMKHLMEKTFIYTPVYREDDQIRPGALPSWVPQRKKYYHSEFYTYHPLALRPGLKYLNLRLGFQYDSGDVLDDILKIKRWLAKTPDLLTLRVDIIGRWYRSVDADIRETFIERWYRDIKMHTSEHPQPATSLRQIIITGLSANCAGMMVIRELALMLAEDGKIGLAVGEKGERYMLSLGGRREIDVVELPEPSLLWLGHKNVGMDCQARGSWLENVAPIMDPKHEFAVIDFRPNRPDIRF